MKKILIITLALLLGSLTYSQVSYNQEFQVNTYVDNWPDYPSMCGLTNGGFVICWQSSDYGIHAQMFDENGIKVGDEIIITPNSISQTKPSICGLLNGGFVICWESLYQEGINSSRGIYAQMYDEIGTIVGDEFHANYFIKGDQIKPSISGLNNGGFIICWTSYAHEGIVQGSGIYAQMYDEIGTKVGNEFHVNYFAHGDQLNSSVSQLNEGGFVICWQSGWDQDGNLDGIFAQMFDNNGQKVGTEFQVNTYSIHNQKSPSVCALINDAFVISWTSYGQDGHSDGIYAQIFDQNGIKWGNEIQVNSYTFFDQKISSISGLTTGGFVICWQSVFQDGSSYGVFAQIFDENGIKVGNEFQVNNDNYFSQHRPKVTGLINGKIVICWQSVFQDGSSYGIFGKYYFGEPINHTLTNFNLIKPELDATINYTNPNFVWRKASETRINFTWELTYDLYIDNDINFADPVIQAEIEDTTYQIDSLASGQTYFWKVLARNYYGDSLWSSDVYGFYIDPTATDIEEIEAPIPEEFELFQNYPNPFNPTTKIKFEIPADVKSEMAKVQLKVYDILGNEIATLVNEQKQPGTYEVEFNGEDLTSGIYFYTVSTGEYSITKKMLLMK